jgi:flagellar hook-associated protein 1
MSILPAGAASCAFETAASPAILPMSTTLRAPAGRILELVNAASAPQSFDAEAGLAGATSLNAFASASAGWLGAQRKQSESAKVYIDAVVSQTTQALSNATGVNLDDQMSRMLALENSYQASAKLLATVNSMFDALFSAVRA